jgi:predicted dehydrogenase
MGKPVRTAVFGLGRMGRGSHVEPLAKDERYRIVAVADRLDANQQRAIDAAGVADWRPPHYTPLPTGKGMRHDRQDRQARPV